MTACFKKICAYALLCVPLINFFVYFFPFLFCGWDVTLIVQVPDLCLAFYFDKKKSRKPNQRKNPRMNIMSTSISKYKVFSFVCVLLCIEVEMWDVTVNS